MVLFDVAEVVEVVDHQPVALLAAALREIGRPVEPFEARAVAEMEAGNRIERQAGGIAGGHEIRRGSAQHRFAHFVDPDRVFPPAGLIEPGQSGAVSLRKRSRRLGALARQPPARVRVLASAS